MNKLSCCIPLSSDDPYTQWPIPSTLLEDVTAEFVTQDDIPLTPISGMDDSVTIETTQESTAVRARSSQRDSSQISTPTYKNIEDTTFSDDPETGYLYKPWD